MNNIYSLIGAFISGFAVGITFMIFTDLIIIIRSEKKNKKKRKK